MDNAKFHKSDKARELIEQSGCTLKFLPSYSPDLNPIENWWSIIKTKIRNIKHKFEEIEDAIDYVLNSINST